MRALQHSEADERAAHLLGQHLPGDARLEDEDDPGEGGSIRNPWAPALRFRLLGGKSGATSAHSASLTNGLLMPAIYHAACGFVRRCKFPVFPDRPRDSAPPYRELGVDVRPVPLT